MPTAHDQRLKTTDELLASFRRQKLAGDRMKKAAEELEDEEEKPAYTTQP